QGPAVSVAVPIKGMEAELDDNLDALFQLDYPEFELIFLVADADDAALPHVRAAIARHPRCAAQIIVGDAKVTGNPKVNNLIKAEGGARHPLMLMCDSNIAIERDTLGRLVAVLDDGVGLVSTVPVAVRPRNFVGELECAMFNGYGARWLY